MEQNPGRVLCCKMTKSLGEAKIENELKIFLRKCVSREVIEVYPLKLGHVVTLGIGSNLAEFRVVSLRNKFSAIFY